VHSSYNVMFRANPGTWKLGAIWERSFTEIAQNSTKPPKIADSGLLYSPEPPEQLGCVPGTERYLKSALVLGPGRGCTENDMEDVATMLDANVKVGRALQVHPIKPPLKPHGTERLILKCDELLSDFGFEFNLRRYIKGLIACTRAFSPGMVERAEVRGVCEHALPRHLISSSSARALSVL